MRLTKRSLFFLRMKYFSYLLLVSCCTLSLSSALYGQLQGNALHFDGSNDRVIAPLPAVFTDIPNNNFTVEVWVKPEVTAFSRILFAQNSTTNFASLSTGNLNQVYWYIVDNGNTYSIATNASLPLNQWSHVSAVWNASTNQVSVYINGVLEAGVNGGSSSDGGSGNNNSMNLGSRPDGFQYFTGGLDEVRIWNFAATSCDITNFMNSKLTGSETGLVTYYDFDHGTPGGNNAGITTLTDYAPGANNGTLTNFALNGNTSNWTSSGADIYIAGEKYMSAISNGLCQGDTIVFGTQSLTTSGVYTEIFPTGNGCDSTVTLTLGEYTAYPGINLLQDICTGDTIVLGSQTITTSGIYTEHFSTVNGCDSVIILTVNENVIDTGVTQNMHVLTALTIGATYQWLDCDNAYAPLAGETGATFTATSNGNYAVAISINGCTDTSACYSVSTLSLHTEQIQVSIFPNPANEWISVNLGNIYQDITVKLYDMNGRLAAAYYFAQTQQVQVDIASLAEGMYMLHIMSDGKENRVKLVKK